MIPMSPTILSPMTVLEGLLSAIFAAYEHHEHPTDVAPEERLQPRLSQRVAPSPPTKTGPCAS